MRRLHWFPAYVGIGSNLDSPADQVTSAIELLRGAEGCRVVMVSSLYESPPLGSEGQPDYVNAVAGIITALQPLQILRILLGIESRQGRVRSGKKWEPRVLDLDLLSYSSVQLATEELTLPHPGIPHRNFVLLPWQEVSPDYFVPGLAAVERLVQQLDDQQTIRKLN